MKKTLRVLSIMLLLAILITAMPLSAFAQAAKELSSSQGSVLCTQSEPMDFMSEKIRIKNHNTYSSVQTLSNKCNVSNLVKAFNNGFVNCVTEVNIASYKIPCNSTYKEALIELISNEVAYSYNFKEFYMNDNGTYFTGIKPIYTMSASVCKQRYTEIEAAKNKMLEGIAGNTKLTDVQKVLLVHDRLALYCEYDFNNGVDQYNIYGALVKGVNVCQAYAEAYDYLMEALGFESYLCVSAKLNHAWNILKVNGKFYHIDVTWDDIAWDDKLRGCVGTVEHYNFLRSSNGIYDTGHTAYDYETYPYDTTYDNYFWQRSDAAFLLVGNEIYYIDNNSQTLNRYSDKASLTSVSGSWYDGYTEWGNHARLATDGTDLFFSLAKGVYKYDISSKTTSKVYSPSLAKYKNIYGFEYTNGYFICDLADAPPYYIYSADIIEQIKHFYDGKAPTASLSATNKLASTQTVTVTMSDNAGIAGYYWGTSSSYSSNSYTSTSSTTVTKTVSDSGTYYFTAKDTSGNLSSTLSVTFYKTKLNGNGVSVSPSAVLTAKGKSFTFPVLTRSGYSYLGWSTNSSASSGVKSLTPTGNATYYAIFEKIPVKVTFVNLYSHPTDTEYYIGESLNTEGLSLKVGYSDGTSKIVTSGFTVSGFSSSSAGTKTITVEYSGFTNTFKVSIITPSVSLSENSITLTEGESYLLTASTKPADKIVAWSTSNSSVAAVSKGTVTAKAAGTAAITATLTYKGYTYTKSCTVTVKAPSVESIKVHTLPSKTVYEMGDELNTSGLKITVTYSNGSTKNITSGFTVSGYSSSVPGEKTVTVTYQKKTATFTVTVKDPPIASIKIHTLPDKLVYEMGEALDTTGLKITIVYKNGTQRNTTSSIKVSGFNTSMPGTKTLTVTYEGVSTTFDITIKEAPISYIGIHTKPSKTVYGIGEALDTSGLKVTVYYKNGSQRNITSGFTTDGYSSATVGTKTVTVGYEGKSASFTVTVTEPAISSITLHTKPEKSVYELGEALDTENLKITINYTNGTKRNTTVGFSVSGFDSVTPGKKTITVNYEGCTVSYNVTVNEPKAVSIEINRIPYTSRYYIGDTLDPLGLSIKVIYNDGSTEIITEGFELINTNLKAEGEKEITVSYKGLKAKFTVEIISPAIMLSNSYVTMLAGEYITISATTDPYGMEVKWSTSDKRIVKVNMGTLEAVGEGEAEITARFTYNGLTYKTVCSVTVNEKTQVRFPDVPDGAWYTEGVYYCANKGYITGTDKGTFDPNGKLTREQFVTILARVAGADLTLYKYSSFNDVKASAWYAPCVIWANEEGYVNGVGNGNFGVGMNMSREQLATMFYRYAQKQGLNTSKKAFLSVYSDVSSVSSWAYEAVAWAVDAGLISSTSTTVKTLSPQMTVTRAQAAKIFMSYDQIS